MFRILVLASSCMLVVSLNAQSNGTASQKAPLLKACEELLREMDRVRRASAGNRKLLEDANEASRSVSWLMSSARSWKPANNEEGQGLRESLERMTAALRNASPQSSGYESLVNIVADDLRAKRTHCAYEGLAARQPVRVATKRQGLTEVKGLEVWYVEKFFESDPNAKPRQFAGFSSPAKDALIPGRYVIWSRESGNPAKDGQRKEARIGKTESDIKSGVAKGSPIDIEVLAP